MLGVHPGLEEDGVEDDRNLVEHQHCEENQTSDSHFVHAAADVGWPTLVAFDPLKKLVVVEQEVARTEAHSLQAPGEGEAPGYSFPVMSHMDWIPLGYRNAAATWLDLGPVVLAEHRKLASERNVEVPHSGELAAIGTEVPGVSAAATVDALEEDEEPGLENFVAASEGDPEAEVVAEEEEEEDAFLAFASAAEGSVLVLAAVDVEKGWGRPGPVDATADAEDAWVVLAFGAADAVGAGAHSAAESGALARRADSEAAAAVAEGAGAAVVWTIEAVGTAAEGAGLVEPQQVSQPRLAVEERGVLQWSQQWA